MKCFGNIFSFSKPAFKLELVVVLVVAVLSLLFMIVAVLFSYAFAFVLSTSSFPEIGLRVPIDGGRHLTTEMTQTDVVLDRPALEGGDVFDFADVHWRRLAFGV